MMGATLKRRCCRCRCEGAFPDSPDTLKREQQQPRLRVAPDSSGSATGYRLIQWCLWEVIERCDPARRCEECPLAADCRGVAREADGFFSIDDAIAIRSRSSRAA